MAEMGAKLNVRFCAHLGSKRVPDQQCYIGRMRRSNYRPYTFDIGSDAHCETGSRI